jgi:hypothetical protein
MPPPGLKNGVELHIPLVWEKSNNNEKTVK